MKQAEKRYVGRMKMLSAVLRVATVTYLMQVKHIAVRSHAIGHTHPHAHTYHHVKPHQQYRRVRGRQGSENERDLKAIGVRLDFKGFEEFDPEIDFKSLDEELKLLQVDSSPGDLEVSEVIQSQRSSIPAAMLDDSNDEVEKKVLQSLVAQESVKPELQIEDPSEEAFAELESIFKEVEDGEREFLHSSAVNPAHLMESKMKASKNGGPGSSSRKVKLMQCEREYQRLREVLVKTKVHEKEEIRKLKSLKQGIKAIIRAFNHTKKTVFEAKTENTHLEHQLTNLQRQINFANELEKEISQLQISAKINYETGKIEQDMKGVEVNQHKTVADLVDLMNDKEHQNAASMMSKTYAFGGNVVDQDPSLIANFIPDLSKFSEKLTDPALLKTDTRLLLDIVTLLCVAVLGGLFVKLTSPKLSPVGAPPVLGYVLGGILVGPSGFDLIKNLMEVNTVSQFGCIFLLFRHGIEYNYPTQKKKRFPDRRGQRHETADFHAPSLSPQGNKVIAIIYVGSTILISWIIQAYCKAMGIVDSNLEGFLVGFTVSISSLTVVIGMLHDKQNNEEDCEGSIEETQKRTKEAQLGPGLEGRMMLSYITFQGIIIGVLFAIPSFLESSKINFDPEHGSDVDNVAPKLFIKGFLKASVLSGLVLFLGWFLANKLLSCYLTRSLARSKKRQKDVANVLRPVSTEHFTLMTMVSDTGKNDTDEIYLLAVISFAIILSLITEYLGLSVDFGAFFAGLMFGGTPLSARTAKAIYPISSLFAALLFSSIGMMVNPLFVWNNLVAITSLVVEIIIIKSLVVYLVLRLVRWTNVFKRKEKVDRSYKQDKGVEQSTRAQDFVMAIELSYVGEFSLLLSSKLYSKGLLHRRLYLLLLSASISTLVISRFSFHIIHFFKLCYQRCRPIFPRRARKKTPEKLKKQTVLVF